jgi:membrane-associated protein
MSPIQSFIHGILHLDQSMVSITEHFGVLTYVILFAIIFVETGVVVMPFLPGDSLLFATGAICALEGSPLQVIPMCLLLIVAAVSGDALNYTIGHRLGVKAFQGNRLFKLNPKHLERTERFFQRHGGKTIILARFVPIVRTFAPFVAGVGRMSYRRFAMFNVTGGVSWVTSFLLLGYWFGNLEFVKRQFHYVLLGIIVLSIMPGAIEWWRQRREDQSAPTA